MTVFKRILIKNFLSIGNKPVELELDKYNITSVSGENGSSKSAICIDSIFYALYGKSFRKVPIPKLINSYNKKGLLVKLWFSIGQNEYVIIRGQKPSIFEIHINGQLKQQMANVKDYQVYLVNHILKMDEKTFRQLVVIGSSSYTPFMNLSAAERRIVIEQLLRIDVFSYMSLVIKKYISETSSLISELEHREDTISLKVEMTRKNSVAISEQLKEQIREQKKDVDSLTESKNQVESKYKSILSSLDEQKIEGIKKNAAKVSEYINTIKQLKMKKVAQDEQTDKVIEFFKEDNMLCPTCTQQLSKEFVEEKLLSLYEKSKKNKEDLKLFDDKIAQLSSEYSEYTKALNSVLDKVNIANGLKKEIQSLESSIQLCLKQISNLEIKILKEQHSEKIDIEKDMHDLNEIRESIKEAKKKQKSLSIIQGLLKDDGIKSIIIKTYLNIINTYIKKYLNIIGYNITFEFDENFNETIHTKHMESFEYNNFSEGEKLRIDSAIMFAFRDLAKIQSSISTNILMLDEFDHGTLDNTGFESIVEILKKCKEENIFIISHSTDYFSSIADRNLLAVKRGNFSEIKVI